ncbi:hypothetical protein [Christensenella minuta]|uniref:hypothetical protein n=1 Tax=Christensenella minuta TaxID=626937 RepID=UPI0021582553|nr:hypothetical protein [Christensenella minuta]
MTREEKAICKAIYEVGKDLRRNELPKRKDGSIIYTDEYFRMLAGIVLRNLPENETLLRSYMTIEKGFPYFYSGFFKHLPYELKNRWQKKRSLRQQRSIQRDTSIMSILP